MSEQELEEIKKKMEEDSRWSKSPLTALRAFHELLFHKDSEKRNSSGEGSGGENS